MGFDPIRPERIQAVYLPAWLIDAVIDAEWWWQDGAEGDQTTRRTATSFFKQSYMPGFIHEPLSRISLNSLTFEPSETIPFSEDLRTQRGSEVLCLPFELTPLHLIAATKSLSYQQATVSERLRFDPPTARTPLFAAYPVLIPVYIAQYETVNLDFVPDISREDRMFTVVIEAHRTNGRIVAENRDKKLVRRLIASDPSPSKFLMNCFDMIPDDEFWCSDDIDPDFIRHFVHAGIPLGAKKKDYTIVERWIDNAASTKGALKNYRSQFFGDTVAIDWEDPRIVEYSKDEVEANRGWMQLTSTTKMLADILKTLSGNLDASRRHDVIQPLHGNIPGSGDDAVKNLTKPTQTLEAMQEQLNILDKQKQETKPKWMKEWERRSAESPNVREGSRKEDRTNSQ
ncbi:uncharacterized protein FIBRA_02119 [Fibroporia radiculosa]|uniref:Uncharacterized protein n=1 Tax=Fibroporia radiculosa TaxID=599839 RepID=J4HUE2_9APHY|nr:uncharacterized protein FIBRA_02119 [Fibroporia radiculosa]CCM00092.1 predicted protein [Fibroporia radiculosa]